MGRPFVLTSLKDKSFATKVFKLYPFVLVGASVLCLVVVAFIYAGATSQPIQITGNRDADGQRLSLDSVSDSLPESYGEERQAISVSFLNQTTQQNIGITFATAESGITVKADLTGLQLPEFRRAYVATGGCQEPVDLHELPVSNAAMIDTQIDTTLDELLEQNVVVVVRGGGEQLYCQKLGDENNTI